MSLTTGTRGNKAAILGASALLVRVQNATGLSQGPELTQHCPLTTESAPGK